MCPFRMNAATRRRRARGDEVARMRGHGMRHDRERLGWGGRTSHPGGPTLLENFTATEMFDPA
eukprot:4311020-Prymnesium_polylepis.1